MFPVHGRGDASSTQTGGKIARLFVSGAFLPHLGIWGQALSPSPANPQRVAEDSSLPGRRFESGSR